MSIGHPYFNREVGTVSPNDIYGFAGQRNANVNALQNQMNQMLGQSQALQGIYVPPPPPFAPMKTYERKSMFKEITTDIKAFLLEHRGAIYFIVFALMLDHFFFKGAFKARLQSMADKVVTKVEEKIK